MSYRGAACDDMSFDLDEMVAVTSSLLQEAGVEACMDRFRSSAELLEAQRQGANWDLILLDIIMEETDGIQLAETLRRVGDDTDIIFITSSPEYALAGYRAYPVTYLLKPLTKEKLKPALSRCLVRRKTPPSLVLPALDGGKLALLPSEIQFIEVFRRELAVHLKDRTIACAGSLSAVLEKLPAESFYRCHRSYVVNLNQVSGVRKYCFLLQNNETVPVAMRTYPEAQSRWLSHLK